MSQFNSLLAAVLSYVKAGFAVLPVHSISEDGGCSCCNPKCKKQGKHPRTTHGFKNATMDEVQVRKWWKNWPNANIGIAISKEYWVLDVDAKNGGLKSLERLEEEYGPLPITVKAQSGGGGFHFYFTDPPQGIRNRSLEGYPGIDVKCYGGSIVVPPSGHVSGNKYKWLEGCTLGEIPFAATPEWLALLLERKKKKAPRASERTPREKQVDTTGEGGRNRLLASYAGVMRRKGMSEDAIFAALLMQNAASCVPPLEEVEVQQIAHSIAKYDPSDDEHLTDVGNAKRLVARHGKDLRYCYASGKWLIWNGQRWRIDQTGEIERRAKETIQSIFLEAEAIEDEGLRSALKDHAEASESATRIRNMINLAQSEQGIPVLPEELDAHPFLLNVTNGTLDLSKGKLLVHCREHLITKLAPVAFDHAAQSPLWLAFLNRIMGGNQRLIGFLQRAVGYALTGDTREQVLFLLYGNGANGKTVFLKSILNTVGDYGKQAEPELLLLSKGDKHPTSVADLQGARFVVTVEVDEGRMMAESLAKQLTGRDRLKARLMRQDFFEFEPTHKLFLAANHKPVIRGSDHGIWRRILLIPFTVTIPDSEQDKQLLDKLLSERTGILNWGLAGCRFWQQRSLEVPEEVCQATNDYRQQMDTLADFLAECCIALPAAKVQAGTLYEAYRTWCARNGEEPLTHKLFGPRLLEKGFKKKRSDVVWYHGVGLKNAGKVREDRERFSDEPESSQVVI